ncbi:MAG: LON peptidase substrate-binding domain-containing protein [Gammaproteobacteria bacterium]|jgi:Lon protease-like protein|nr:LON peptidase substrate-binding domain-containing protein [Gammaproteobacteria bacterium]
MLDWPDNIALFPLRTVLFPGGILPLRIFETRYLNMIRDCSRAQSPFGICLLLDTDTEAEQKSTRARMTTIGTAAEIIDFNTTDDGLLSVVARGTRRFQILATQVKHDGLISADVSWIPVPTNSSVQPQHATLVDVLRQLHEQIVDKLRKQAAQKDSIDVQSLLQDCDYDDAASVGFRLADLLPLDVHDQQVLLEMQDPDERLDSLLRAISMSNDESADPD